MVVALPFFVLTAGFVLIGLSQMHASAQGSPGAVGWIIGKLTGAVAAIANLAIQATRALTSRFASAQLALLAAFFSGMAALWKVVFTASGDVAHATAHAIEAVWDAIPHEIERALSPVRRLARRAEHTATHALHLAESTTHALDHLRARVNARLRSIEHTVTVTLPHEIGRIRTREKELERVYEDLRGAVRDVEHGAIRTWEWLRSHERSAAMGAFATVVAAALARLGFGMFRCRDWQRLGRSLKCSDANILADLLALATGLLATQVSLSEFVRFLQGIEDEAVGELHNFIKD